MEKFIIRHKRKKDDDASTRNQSETETPGGELQSSSKKPVSTSLSEPLSNLPYPDMASLQSQQTIPDNEKVSVLTNKWIESQFQISYMVSIFCIESKTQSD